jgi:hypothetical protein
MSIIESLRTFIKGYSGLKTGVPLWVDFLGTDPTQYSIIPLPGERIIDWSIDDSESTREFPFALDVMQSTADQAKRMESAGFGEAFADWLETQWLAGTMPTLDTGKTSYKIEALGWGYLFEQGQSETGIYQIQCKLTYTQVRQP